MVFWILLAVLGIVPVVMAQFVSLPGSLVWGALSILWLIDGIWISLHFLKMGGRKKNRELLVGNAAVYTAVTAECRKALNRYLSKVVTKRLMRRSALYDRPFLALCGPEQSGKSRLLSASGLRFAARYPSERDGMAIEGESKVEWHFGNEAVWIDLPGNLLEESGQDEWKAWIKAIQNGRPEKPLDGIVLVVSTPEILNRDPGAVRDMARGLRERLDELVSSWMVEFPVYLVFSRMDEVPGFTRFFSQGSGDWGREVLGATLSGDQQRMLPRRAFLEEYALLSNTLSEYRGRRLAKEKDPAAKRLLCRFVIHFAGMKEKLGVLVAELFRPTDYEGRPIFRGFYFTGAQLRNTDESGEQVAAVDVSNTIANHPLNPNRAAPSDTTRTKRKSGDSYVSWFVTSLFSRVMSSGNSLVRQTQKGSRRSIIRHYGAAGAIMGSFGLIALILIGSFKKSQAILNDSMARISQSHEDSESVAGRYRRLGAMANTLARLENIERGGLPLQLRLGFYHGTDVIGELRPRFLSELRTLVIQPSTRILERSLGRQTSMGGRPTGEDHSELYRTLKAYLSISEAVADNRERIDTSFVFPILYNSIAERLIGRGGDGRLPAELETAIRSSIGLYLRYLYSEPSLFIQQDQRLVRAARVKLRRLPDAKALYATVANRLEQELPRISLDELLGRTDGGILYTDQKVSSVYTKEGFTRYVVPAIAKASSNPFEVDWVLNLSKDDLPASMLDPGTLKKGMIDAYMNDTREAWLGFLSSIRIQPFAGIGECARSIRRLASENSELKRVLVVTSEAAMIDPTQKTEETISKAAGAAGKLKPLKKFGKRVDEQAVAGSIASRFGSSSIHSFQPVLSFAQSSPQAGATFGEYREILHRLAEALSETADREEQVVRRFVGLESDPLLDATKFTTGYVEGLPEALAPAVGNILHLPLERSSEVVSHLLAKRLNLEWEKQVVKPFANTMAGRFPFAGGEDASFDDVMEFFRPKTGTFWGFHSRVLSGFLARDEKGWETRSVGMLHPTFMPGIDSVFLKAEKIANAFMRADGTLRVLELSLSASPTNTHSATLNLGANQKAVLGPGTPPSERRWPEENGENGAVLKIHVANDFDQDLRYSGQWGLMKLFDDARINHIAAGKFVAKWQTNVQNMYVVQVGCRVVVSDRTNPFEQDVLKGFECPRQIVVYRKPDAT